MKMRVMVSEDGKHWEERIVWGDHDLLQRAERAEAECVRLRKENDHFYNSRLEAWQGTNRAEAEVVRLQTELTKAEQEIAALKDRPTMWPIVPAKIALTIDGKVLCEVMVNTPGFAAAVRAVANGGPRL